MEKTKRSLTSTVLPSGSRAKYGGRAVLTPGSVEEFMGQCEDTRHFVDIKNDTSGNLVVTSLHENKDGTIEQTYLGIDYDKEYPRGCLSGLL